MAKRRVLFTAMLLGGAVVTPSIPVVHADPVADLATATANLAGTQKQIADIESQMGALSEQVNKALVDLHDSQADAAEARKKADDAKQSLTGTQNDLTDAQQKLNEVARTAYKQGAVSGTSVGNLGGSAQDSLDRQTYLRTNAEKQQSVVNSLEQLRAQQANDESNLRAAAQTAEQKAKDAENAESQARQNYEQTASQLKDLQAQRTQLLAQQQAAQAALTPPPTTSSPATGGSPGTATDAQQLTASSGSVTLGKSDTVASQTAGTTDPMADLTNAASALAQATNQINSVNNTVSQVGNLANQVNNLGNIAPAAAGLAIVGAAAAAVVGSGQAQHTSFADPFLTSLSSATGTNANATSFNMDQLNSTIESVTNVLNTANNAISGLASGNIGAALGSLFGSSPDRNAKIETVISRAQSQLGVPYAWGGGNANGPTKGIRDGGVADSYGDYNKVGFDCSGLVMYAFAGVGINLPHYSGYQYERGQKIDPKNMQRGDLIFYGPGGATHVAIYLGNGQMIEAPQSGDVVKVSPVRWSGMSPYAVRLI
ncbi:MAG: NlpC/P60 family protein [Corynebacterium sp.]|nr:NlpC/P60 family protein [Corynebacterium sp.]